MKRTLMLSLSMLFVVATVSIANAEEGEERKRGPRKGGDAREGHKRGPGDVFKKLNLSDDQKASMKEIHETFAAEMKAAREAKDRDAGKAAHEKRHAAVMDILNDDQKEILKKMRKHRGPRDGDRKGPPRKGKGEGDRKGKGKRPGGKK